MSKFHYFQPDIAAKYGVNAAILLENIAYWIEKNEANEKHFYDGKYWTYNSVSAFTNMFPYMSEKTIRSALNRLVDEGLIEKGNYNSSPYDRTMWYALTEKGVSICPKGQMENPETANRNSQKGEPIPDNKPSNKPNNKHYMAKPTLDDVRAYARERGSNVDADAFFDFYQAGDWIDSRGNPVRNWKQKFITWEKKSVQGTVREKKTAPKEYRGGDFFDDD